VPDNSTNNSTISMCGFKLQRSKNVCRANFFVGWYLSCDIFVISFLGAFRGWSTHLCAGIVSLTIVWRALEAFLR